MNDSMLRRKRKLASTHEIALIASDGDGCGMILAFDGDRMNGEIRGLSSHIGDLGELDKAPAGLSIWEGEIEYVGTEDVDTYFRGAFRPLEPSERYRYAVTGCPWAFIERAA